MLGLARAGVSGSASVVTHVGRVRRAPPCARSPGVDAVGKRCRLTGRPARYGSIAGAHRGVVADEVALGDRRPSRLRRPGTAPCRGCVSFSACSPSCHVPLRAEGVEGGQLVGRRRPTQLPLARPRRRRRGLDLVVGPSRLHRPGMVLGVPARRRRRRRACASSSHCSARSPAPGARARTDRAASRRGARSGGRRPRPRAARSSLPLGRCPGAPVPHDHVAAAVLAARDDALEVEVVERVVLDVDGQALDVGVERRALRHRPADAARRRPRGAGRSAGAGPGGAARRTGARRRRRRRPRRLGRDAEVALGPVPGQTLGGGAGHAHCLPTFHAGRHPPWRLPGHEFERLPLVPVPGSITEPQFAAGRGAGRRHAWP